MPKPCQNKRSETLPGTALDLKQLTANCDAVAEARAALEGTHSAAAYFAEFLWQEGWSSRLLKPSLMYTCTVLRQFLDFLDQEGIRSVTRIRAAHTKKFFARLRAQGVKGAHMRSAREALSQVFNQAIADGLLARNPARGHRIPVGEVVGHLPFVRAEVARILAAMDELGPIGKEWKRAVLIASYTALRPKDVFRARWGQFEFGFHSHGVLAAQPSKTAQAGIRLKIPLHLKLAELLNMPCEQPQNPSEFICPTLARRHPSNLRRMFAKILASAGVSSKPAATTGRYKVRHRRTFYSFRHTVNTLLSLAGVGVRQRMQINGQRQEPTAAIYDCSDKAPDDAAGEVVDQLPPLKIPSFN